MHRLLVQLLIALMVTSALAGCFHSDDDGDKDGHHDDNDGHHDDDNMTADNNTTDDDPFPDALIPPTPSINVTVDTAGSVLAPPYYISSGTMINITLDGNGSSDPDGSIAGYAWTVTGPGNFTEQGSGATYTFNHTLRGTNHGAYKVELKVIDDDNILNKTSRWVIFNYGLDFTDDRGMLGPGTEDCGSTDSPAGSQVGSTGFAPGTYRVHSFTLASNATNASISVTFEAGTAGNQLALRLFLPDADTTACGEAIGEEEAADSPATLTADAAALTAPGSYQLRIDLDGANLGAYTVSVRADYEDPSA